MRVGKRQDKDTTKQTLEEAWLWLSYWTFLFSSTWIKNKMKDRRRRKKRGYYTEATQLWRSGGALASPWSDQLSGAWFKINRGES